MTSINFGAKYIRPVVVQQRQEDTYQYTAIALVELASGEDYTEDKNDIVALKTVANSWKARYARNIANDMSRPFKDSIFGARNHFYALTTQKDSFDTFEAEKVLALAEFCDNDVENCNELKYIQVKPNAKPNYKKIGSGLLDAIKKIHSTKSIKAFLDTNVIPFYEQNGFKQEFDPYERTKYVWHNLK